MRARAVPMVFRVVTIWDNGPYGEEHRTRIAVVKHLEEDDDAWGVVGYYPTLTSAHRAAHEMRLQYRKLEEISPLTPARVASSVHTMES